MCDYYLRDIPKKISYSLAFMLVLQTTYTTEQVDQKVDTVYYH